LNFNFLYSMRNIRHEQSKRKANWIGHILCRNCLLQRVIEGKVEGGIEVTGRRGRRRRKLLDDLKERRGYSHLKEEALDRTVWRTGFGRGFGPVVRQTAEWMNTVQDSLSGKLGRKSLLDVEPHSQKIASHVNAMTGIIYEHSLLIKGAWSGMPLSLFLAEQSSVFSNMSCSFKCIKSYLFFFV